MFSNLGAAPASQIYPYAAWDMDVIRITELAIQAAWGTLASCAFGRETLLNGTEPQITAALRNAVEDLLNAESIPGFTPAVFGCVPRGQELEDHSGKYIEKRPDLTFQLLSARPVRCHNALFYECKILGKGRTLKAYVEEGVSRFVDGKYAWCMPHSGMIAYLVDATYTENAYGELHRFWSLQPPPACVPITLTSENNALPIAVSIHARRFALQNGKRPGDISLRHLWLQSPNLTNEESNNPFSIESDQGDSVRDLNAIEKDSV